MMRRHRLRLTVVLAFLLLSTAGVFSASPPGAAQEAFFFCNEHDPQPEHPLEMDTVVSNPTSREFGTTLLKHVIMEKFIWECTENFPSGEERRFVRDQEIFIEIVQRVQAGRTTTVEKRVEEVVCDKSVPPAGGRVTAPLAIDCATREVPLPDVPSERFECARLDPAEFFPQPTDPVEMNTVITARQDTVMTMKTEKEIFFCRSDVASGFGHLFLITEIVEQRAGATGADSIRPTEKKFQAIMCIARAISGRLEECGHFVPGPTPA